MKPLPKAEREAINREVAQVPAKYQKRYRAELERMKTLKKGWHVIRVPRGVHRKTKGLTFRFIPRVVYFESKGEPSCELDSKQRTYCFWVRNTGAGEILALALNRTGAALIYETL